MSLLTHQGIIFGPVSRSQDWNETWKSLTSMLVYTDHPSSWCRCFGDPGTCRCITHWVLGFVQERIQRQASIEFKVKMNLSVKQWDRKWATLQTQKSPFSRICFLYWSSFNRVVREFNNTEEYSESCCEGGGDFSEEPCWPFYVLIWAFGFQPR